MPEEPARTWVPGLALATVIAREPRRVPPRDGLPRVGTVFRSTETTLIGKEFEFWTRRETAPFGETVFTFTFTFGWYC